MLTDHFSYSGSNPPPLGRPTLHIQTDRWTYRLMVITLSVLYTALRATTRLKKQKEETCIAGTVQRNATSVENIFKKSQGTQN